MHTCIYTHLHIYMHVCVHIYIYIYIYIYVRICITACLLFKDVCVCVCAYKHVRTDSQSLYLSVKFHSSPNQNLEHGLS